MKEGRGITPLRTILRNCLNHIENLETNRSIYDNYDKEFQDLKQFSETLKVQKEFATTEGEKEVNRKKNRYKDILPFNVSRVVLSEYAGIPGSDYINANFIKGASGSPAYIASQGPLPNTVNDFWRMVVECEVQVIVMACNAQESGKHKCENYWVEKEGEEKRFGMVQICLVKASTVCPDFLVRTMRIKYTNDKDITEERTVCQFHYSAWPDHGVPPLVRPLLDMVRLVRDTQASETLPVLVHCSAGCGRTGTICAIDFVWGLLRAGKLTEEFSLFNLVRDMRKQRVAMVQTKEQYILVHQAVRELFKEQLRVIESHPYENIDFNGVPLVKDLEEPFYDTIRIQKEENCDEKQDKSEIKEKMEDSDSRINKKDLAPPLPRKKRPNVVFSKQEKEAENFTEKNRLSISEKEKADASHSGLLGKPRIVKLRALFEKSPTTKERSALKDKGSQTVSRSHSLGAFRKPLTSEIFEVDSEKNKNLSQSSAPDNNKLKHSKSFSKSVPLIKRSKSLKTFSPSFNLSVAASADEPVDRKSLKSYSFQYEENEIIDKNKNEQIWMKPLNISEDFYLVKEYSRRRRSLESLMGDAPPAITWPIVMSDEKIDNNLKAKQKFGHSPKVNSNKIHDNKTADLIRQQLQRLSVETEKKINNIPSGIGTRERRNSFRQAVTKNDFQNVFRKPVDLSAATIKSSENNYFSVPNSKSVNNVEEISHHSSKVTSGMILDREGIPDLKSSALKVKPVFTGKKYKLQNTTECNSSESKQFESRYSMPENSNVSSQPALSAPSHHLIDSRSRKIVSVSNFGPKEEIEQNLESKNLFLKKLNSEIMSERERDLGRNSTFGAMPRQLNNEEIEKPSASLYSSGQILVHSDSKKALLKGNSKPLAFGLNSDELDGSSSKSASSMQMLPNEKIHPNSRSQFHSHQTPKKSSKISKFNEDYKQYPSTQVPKNTFYNSTRNLPRKEATYHNISSDVSSNLKKNESTPVLQSTGLKESFLLNTKKTNSSMVSNKPYSENGIVPMGGYVRNANHFNSELYNATNSDIDNAKKLMLPSKLITADKNSKTFDCLPWSYSTSSRASGEVNVANQQANKPDSSRLFTSYKNDNIINPDIKLNKTDQSKMGSKDSDMVIKNCEMKIDSNKRRQETKPNSGSELCNQGASGSQKIRQNSSKCSKDDFLINEPTAPPRVKRHASITIPRGTGNNSNHVANWSLIENKLGGDPNMALEANKNAWNESFGVDLDAVAASMQQNNAGESSTVKNRNWTGKHHNTPANSNFKKKQHYF